MPPLMSADEARKNTAIFKSVKRLLPTLETADLFAGDFASLDTPISLGIERKTYSNLMMSLGSGELDDQLARMVDAYDFPVLLIEGLPDPNWKGEIPVYQAKRGFSYAWVAGSIIGWYARGVLPFFVPSWKSTAPTVAALVKFAEKDSHRTTFKPKRLTSNLRPMTLPEKIMVQFGGVGIELATRYREEIPAHLANRSAEDWVADLGKVRGKRVYDEWQYGSAPVKGVKGTSRPTTKVGRASSAGGRKKVTT